MEKKMEEADDFSFFCELLDEILRQGVQQVEVLGEVGAIESQYSWKITVPVLGLCLSGTQSLVMRRDGQTLEKQRSAGHAFVLVPGCWLGANPQKQHETLQIQFRSQATNFILQRFEAGPDSLIGFPENTHKRFYTSPGRLDAVGYELHRFLLHPPVIGAEHYAKSLYEALLCKAREVLVATSPGSKAHQTWQNARHFIEAHCEQSLSREGVARALKLHPNYLSQLFAGQGEESFSAFLLRVRLERARHLLKDPALNVSEVARLSGFNDANYFIRAFKKRYAITPGRARQMAAPRGE